MLDSLGLWPATDIRILTAFRGHLSEVVTLLIRQDKRYVSRYMHYGKEPHRVREVPSNLVASTVKVQPADQVEITILGNLISP